MEAAERALASLEILVLANAPKDAELTANILRSGGYRARVLTKPEDLEATSAGLFIISEECLTPPALAHLRATISAQPQWSDLPIIAVTAGGSSATASIARLEQIAKYLQNVTLLERPIRLATFLTIVRTALSSRRKQFELKALLEDLERSKRAAEKANQAKSMFLANMSHEIRTPLTAIVGFAGLLRNPNVDLENRKRYVDVIARNSDQLASLINDVLDLSKVEAGKVEIELRAVALGELAQDLETWLRPLVQDKGLDFRLQVEGALPDRILTDSTRIRQIVLNLVSNAVKFTAQGSISVRVWTNGERLCVTVTDTGIGMPPAVREKLFQPFTQADSSMTRKYGGTGLGLALSKALAIAMGGELELLESVVGQGSRFELRVPVVPVTQTPTPVEAGPLDTAALRGKRVLLAEDSPDNVFLVTRYLEEAGLSVTPVRNGREAVDLALAEPFGVVLMDIQMPVLDGLSATAELRRRAYRGPIIALTAHALREEWERSIAAGCDDHLTKPIDRELLLRKIASCVS